MEDLDEFNIISNEEFNKDFNELGPVEKNYVITLIITK